LVTYASGATTNSILTSDFSSLEDRLQTFSPCGATAEPDGMQAALNEIISSGRANAYGQRIMILLTDGQANMTSGHSYTNSTATYSFLGTTVTTQIPSAVASAMATQTTRAVAGHVRIYCVTFGTSADTAVHQVIASKTGGAFYHTEDQTVLADIFTDIFNRLPAIITQ
jgi:Mg-chelatase subunit ChlD